MNLPVWFRPWMVWLVLVAVLCLLLGIQTVRLAGTEKAVSEEVAAHSETKRLYAVALAASISEARKTENELRADLEQQQAAAAKEKEIAKAREDALVESVRTGQRRLSVAAVCPGSGAAGIRAGASGGSGPGVSRAELDPAAADRIVAITIDGDQAIRERNACVAAYDAVRKRLNGVE